MSDDKATVSLSKILNTGVRKHGKTILTNLTVALKLSRMYEQAHRNVQEALDELNELLAGFIRLQGSVRLTRISDFLFLNDVRIQVDIGGYDTYRFVVELFECRDIGEVCFSSGVTRSELETFISLLNTNPPDPARAWDGFCEDLTRFTLPHVQFDQHEEHEDVYEDITKDARVLAIHTFFKSIGVVGKALRAASNGQRVNLKSLKTASQAMVDLTLDSQHLLVALTGVKTHGSPGANHAVNVAILSISLGAKLGLSKKLLGDLGIVAFLHDVGKIGLPEDIQKTPRSQLSSQQEETYWNHVYDGSDRLLTQNMVHQIVKSMNVAFLHHYRYDRTGFPRLMATKEQNLFTRIVAVANYYDNATTPGEIDEQSTLPDVLLRDLMDRSGTEFDPLVVKAFVNLVGLYPVGCMVRLDDGSVGTVVAPPSNPRYLDRPSVRLVTDAAGNPSSSSVNLLDKDASGGFRRTILKLYQQEEVELELDEYLAVI